MKERITCTSYIEPSVRVFLRPVAPELQFARFLRVVQEPLNRSAHARLHCLVVRRSDVLPPVIPAAFASMAATHPSSDSQQARQIVKLERQQKD